MIGVERKQPQPGAISPGHCSATAADSQGIEPFAVGPLAALDQLPTQALAALELVPGHGLEKAEGLENSPDFLFAKGEQVGLKFWIVEVDLNQRLPR